MSGDAWLKAYDAWKLRAPDTDDPCPECSPAQQLVRLASCRCCYCGELFCEEHVLDHGEFCDRLAALDADLDGHIDALNDESAE